MLHWSAIFSTTHILLYLFLLFSQLLHPVEFDFNAPQILHLEIFLNVANLKEAVDITRKRGFNISDPTMNNKMHYDLISELDNNVNELLLSTPLESRAKVYEEHYGASIDIGFRYNFK